MYLQANNVEKFYGDKEARVQTLKGISCGIRQGEVYVLLGPSGSGKFTSLNLIGGIERIDEGESLIGGEDLAGMSDKELTLCRRHTLGSAFRSYHLAGSLAVRENTESEAYLGRYAKSIEDLLERLGLTQYCSKYPNRLSEDQQQHCAIGRALAKSPELPPCDESTGAPDYHTSRSILRLLGEINRDFQTTVILAAHNVASAVMTHRVLRLKDGRITRAHCNTQRVTADVLEWQVIVVRNPLHKSLKEESLRNRSHHISLSLVLILMVGVITGFLSVAYSVKELLVRNQISSKVEDGQFILRDRMDAKTKIKLEALGLRAYEQLHIEQSVSRDAMVRVHRKRSDINRATLHEGRVLNKQMEIAPDRFFVLKNGYSIRDTIRTPGKGMTTTGLISTPDYTSLIQRNSGMMVDPTHFDIAIVTDTSFQALSIDRVVHGYSYYLNDRKLNSLQK